MKNLYNKEFLTKTTQLNEEQIKLYINHELKILDLNLLKKFEIPFSPPFVVDWNNFIQTGVISDLIVNCYYENLKFKASHLGSSNEKWAIETPFFHNGNISHDCKSSGWSIHFYLDSDFLPYFENHTYLKLTQENLQKYEISKLFCIENLLSIKSLYEERTEGCFKNDQEGFLKKLYSTTKDFLLKLDTKKLPLINTMGYSVPFFNAWNNFVKGELKEKEMEHDMNLLAYGFAMDLASRKNREIKNGVVELSTIFNFTSDSNLECRETGEKFYLNFDNSLNWKIFQWEPKIVKIKGENIYTGKYVPIKPRVFENKIYQKEINFLTGNLLINDWFKFTNDEFTELVDKVCEEDVFKSINSSQGRVIQISNYIDKLNFISVNVGNTSPDMFKFDNSLVFGRGDESNKAYLGSVCTDLWNVSIIEEEHLEALLISHGMKKDLAHQAIAKLKTRCLTTKVDPGVYVLSFTGDYKTFEKKSKKKFKNITPYFILEKNIK